MSRGKAHRGMMDLDLGLDEDDDDLGFGGGGGGREKKKEESISDLIGGRDSMKMFGGGSRRDSSSNFRIGGGVDPLESMMMAASGKGGVSAQQDEEEDSEFEREMMRQMGMAGFDVSGGGEPSSVSRAKSRSVSPAARGPSPSPGPAPSGSGSDESLADIVGDILGDDTPGSKRPARAEPKRKTTPPRIPFEDDGLPSSLGQPGLARSRGPPSGGVSNAGTNDWDEDENTPSVRSGFGARQREASGGPAESRMGLGGASNSSRRPSRVGGDVSPPMADRSPAQGFRQGDASDRENSRGPADRFGGMDFAAESRFGESFGGDVSMMGGAAEGDGIVGRRAGGRRKLASRPSVPNDDNDPLADLGIYGSGGGGSAASRPGRSTSPAFGVGVGEQDSTLGLGTSGLGLGGTTVDASGMMEVELAAKPKRRLGKAKAQPFPAQTQAHAAAAEEEQLPEPAADPGRPPAGASTPPSAPPRACSPPQASTTQATGPHSAMTPLAEPVLQMPSVPPPVEAEQVESGDSGDLDDLLQDNTAPPVVSTPPAATTPVATTPQPTPSGVSQGTAGAERAGEESDAEIPDFLKSRSEQPRVLRGAAPSRSPASAMTPPPATPAKSATPPKSAMPPKSATSPKSATPQEAALNLGFSAEDLELLGQSASAPEGLPSAAGGSGSGPGGNSSGAFEVPLTATAGSGRRKLGGGSSPGPSAAASAAARSTGQAAQVSAAAVSPGATSGAAGAAQGPPAASVQPVATPAASAAESKAPSVAKPLPVVAGPGTPGQGAGQGMAGVGIAGFPAQLVQTDHAAMAAFHAQAQAQQAAMAALIQAPQTAAYGMVGQGLDPGSPLTGTVQSAEGSYRARYHVPEAAAAPADLGQVRAAHAGTAAAAALMADNAAGLHSPKASRLGDPGGAGTHPSEKDFSLFGADPLALGNPAPGGFSAFPPLAGAPSHDLFLELAQSKAKVKHVELQLEDCEQRWQRRFEDAKKQEDAGHSRMELQCRYLEAELDRYKEMHASELRHLHEQKQLLIQGHSTEIENARREERRKAQLELDKVKADYAQDLDDSRRKHERAVAILKQQADMEAESLRRAHSGEHQLAKLVEQVQGSVAEVERMSKRVDSDKSVEWSVRERQLEAREQNVREMESRLSAQTKEVEEQRRRVSELVRKLEDSQVDDRSALSSERERLTTEHARLLELQQSVREADRNNKEALKHAWAQVEDERRTFQQDHLRLDSEIAMRKEEVELQERQVKQEAERLKNLHQQIEVARQNAARRIRETEATVANERRCLMNDLEVFEEKRRLHAQDAMKLDADKKGFTEEKENFESELRSVGLMAQEVERRSEEVKKLHDEAAEAQLQIHTLRSQLQEERSAQGSEMERLKTMQTLIEQQRLQLLQTENQMRVRGIEDMDLLVTTTQAHFGPEVDMALPASGPTMEAREVPGGGLTHEAAPLRKYHAEASAEPVSMGRRDLLGTGYEALGSKEPLRRPLATPCRAGGSLLGGGGIQIHTQLQRTRQENGLMQTYILESAQFLQKAQMSMSGPHPTTLAGASRLPDHMLQQMPAGPLVPAASAYGMGGLPGLSGYLHREVNPSPSFGTSSSDSRLEDLTSSQGSQDA
eukprot:TRINITY_DN15425_c0_g1_i4.p1 TRINITY_DN15425_c0_g1~~TRINITY_DN15425_c0_g1_i4.p1  ORF type:complete len:1612 (+),score=418.83 TRINITY_DN15425_c0_g1_i4:65-4900(+)